MAKLEILAPAGSMEALEAAVRCGADAVYLGQKNFSARKNSQNFDEEELCQAVAYAHRCGVSIHQALNILVFDQELEGLRECIRIACKAGVDALIVQDWGVAAMVRQLAPDMPLHASTQMAIHSPAGVRLAESLGFSRVVLARELSRKEIEAIVRSTTLETEIFVHGAHCMSISGQCYMSAAIGGNSGNRGQCAQPCRLPFTAGCPARSGVGENVLSLKDMSLVEQLPLIEEMGVTSVKIEGRMKRPEYVAAAVTACRRALEGEDPRMDQLQAVFSRSGFTSGYFEGKRDRQMFGFRTKSDVQAAGEVLSSMRQLYHKQTPLVPVDMTFSMETGQPVRLTLTDGTYTVMAQTDQPPETADHGGTDAGWARGQLSRLGGTPYFLRNFEADIQPGLMLRASACNALRREACTQLDLLREQRPRTFQDLPLPPLPHHEAPKVPESWGQFARLSQVTPLAAQALSCIILPANELTGEASLPCDREKILPALPRFTFSEAGIPEMLEKLRQQGFTEIYCDSPAHLALCREAGLIPRGGLFLNLSNSLAVEEARKQGLQSAVLSPEGKLGWLHSVQSAIPLGIMAYGRLTLMALRNCPIKAQIGCRSCGGQGFLIDRTHVTFPVRCDGQVSYVYNSLPTSLTDRQSSLRGFDFALLVFTTEQPQEVDQVMRCWQQGEKLPQPATRGLYLRGV